MPVLRGDLLIGRADVARDPADGLLIVKALYAEPGGPSEAAEDIRDALDSLADFVGAERVTYLKMPPIWADALD